jgi:nitrate/nitrite-specific signal transduction histidine kinase
MNRTAASTLYRRITRLRWQVPLLAFALVLMHQILEHTLLLSLPPWQHFGSQMLFYGLVGPALAWWALTSLRHKVVETEKAEQALQQTQTTLSKVNQRLTFLIRVNRRLAVAEDEDTLIATMLELPLQVVPAVSCSLIRFDDRRQPMPAVHHGQVKPKTLDRWATHLSDALVRQECTRCNLLTAVVGITSCPLLAAAPGDLAIGKVHCLRLARNDHLYGVLAIYLADDQHPTERERSLLDALAQEMSLALESQHLRGRELAMLSRLQQASRLSNLRRDLHDVLTDTVTALEADGAVLYVVDTETAVLQLQAKVGRPLDTDLSLIKSMAEGAGQSETPLVIGNLEREDTGVHSLLIAPLHTENQQLGQLVLWAGQPEAFTRRHAQLVAIVAGQAALLVENQRLYLRGEHQIMLAERARLAREIHDGLAQTLGYLKLRTTLIVGQLQNDKVRQATAELVEVQQLLNTAAINAREAIDGLHLKNKDADLQAWSQEIISEFEMLSNIPVVTTSVPNVNFPLEIHAQLQRIVQESFSNVRKHADATRAWLEWQQDEQWLTLLIRDNGHGFDPDDVPPIARHGLRIMRERAELLEADFQITSQPGHGTQISVTLPLKKHVGERKYD